MVAPAVLAAAQKAAKVAKAAKKARQAASGGGDRGDGKGKDKSNLKLWLVLGGSGGLLTFGGISLVTVILMGMIGGTGNGAVAAACGDYADNANAGNTGDAAATNPILPAGKMYMPSETARNEIPPKMILAAMRAAARYDGLDWALIAGQMYQETKYGQHPSAAPGGKNSLGYMGILQFGTPPGRTTAPTATVTARRTCTTSTTRRGPRPTSCMPRRPRPRRSRRCRPTRAPRPPTRSTRASSSPKPPATTGCSPATRRSSGAGTRT